MTLLSLKTILYRLKIETQGPNPPVKDAVLVKYCGVGECEEILFSRYIWVSRYDTSICWHRWSDDFVENKFKHDRLQASNSANVAKWLMIDEEEKVFVIMNSNKDYFRVVKI